MRFLLKYNLEIFTLIMAGMIGFATFFMPELTGAQKIMLCYMFLFTVHGWEEHRFPGRFSIITASFFMLDITPKKDATAQIPAFLFILAITFIPFFCKFSFLILLPILWGLFEIIIHLIGISFHSLRDPYSPGMISAFLLAFASGYFLFTLASSGTVGGIDFAMAAGCLAIGFIIVQRIAIAIYGSSYREIFSNLQLRFPGY